MPERQLRNLSASNELGAAQLPASCRLKSSAMLADRVPLEDHAVACDGFAEKPLLVTQRPTVTFLV
jgi:hypothetical protein